MAFKIGTSVKKAKKSDLEIKDYFTANTDEILTSAIYWLLVNKVAVMVAANRAGDAICITLYQDKGKEPIWCNTPEEFLERLIDLNTRAAEGAKADRTA